MSKHNHIADFVLDFEMDGGEMSQDEIIAGFQELVDTGMAWQLQGYYGRTAAALIEAGLVSRHEYT